MGRVGRDPEFLKQVDLNVSSFILSQAESAIVSELASDNHILRYCLTGSYQELRPYYMQPENFELIKDNISKLEFKAGLIHEIDPSEDQFDLFNLSNIFEYMDNSTFKTVVEDLNEIASPSAKFGYWNLMVTRSIPNVVSHVKSQLPIGTDKGFFYNRFCIDELALSKVC